MAEHRHADGGEGARIELVRKRQCAIVKLASEPAIWAGDIASASRIITETSAGVFDVDRVSVWLLSENRQELVCQDLFETSSDTHTSGAVLLAKDYPEYFKALRSGRALDANNAREDDRTIEFLEGYLVPNNISSMLDGVIRTNGEVIGVVCHEPVGVTRDWTPEEVAFAGEIADQVANAIFSAQRHSLEAQLRQAQKLEALGTLAGGIAHDFNNIVSAIIGNSELARLESGDPVAVTKCLNEINTAAHRAKDLVKRILAFSRQQETILASIQLESVVDEAVKLLRSTIPTTVELDFRTAPDLHAIHGDASQIHQVVMNLTTNAWHALNENSGRISIELDEQTVDSQLSRLNPDLHPGPYVRLTVNDTGTGMNAQTLERIFEPFYTNKPQGKGTGLGLSMVHGIVKSHEGAVMVTSNPGQGTSFQLYFPSIESPSAPIPPLKITPRAKGNGQEILFLDDEKQLVYLAERMLERLGYRVSGFTEAEKAIEAFRKDPHRYSLVVTDRSMPGMSGLEVAREMLIIRPGTPIVLASGYLEEDEAERALEAGILEVIFKPDTVDELGQLIHDLLARRAENDE